MLRLQDAVLGYRGKKKEKVVVNGLSFSLEKDRGFSYSYCNPWENPLQLPQLQFYLRGFLHDRSR